MLFQGESVFPEICGNDDYPSFIIPTLERLKPKETQALAGNSYHMVTMGQCMMYCYSSVTLKSTG